MGPVKATISCMSKPFTWKGRASPSEYWWFALVQTLVPTAAMVPLTLPYVSAFQAYQAAQIEAVEVAYKTFSTVVPPPFPDLDAIFMGQWQYWLALVVVMIWPTFAGLAAMVRRLHDSGRSGWWYWISTVPLIGPILLLILLAAPGDIHRNRFGPGRVEDVERSSRRGDMPAVPRDPMAHLRSAEDLRGLRHSRMAGGSAS